VKYSMKIFMSSKLYFSVHCAKSLLETEDYTSTIPCIVHQINALQSIELALLARGNVS
jgi:hypothetical protein